MSAYRVNPYRFTHRPVETRALLELIGLRPVTTRGGFATLRGSGGVVGVHSVASAVTTDVVSTSLVLEADDATMAADQLVADGLDARWWDEAWGRQAAVVGPEGVEITINESPVDTYGYETHADEPGDVEVIGVLFTRDLDAWSAFFVALGFTGDGDAHWRALRADRGAGVIGLHLADDSRAEGECVLGLQVAEPLAELAGRLRSAGYDAEERSDLGVASVVVTDPDGEPLEIHARA